MDVTFIVLPGFTMDSSGLTPLTDKLKKMFTKAKFIKLNPPYRKVSIYKNMRYRAWYDYFSNYRLKEECIDTQQLIESRNRIHNVILKESKYTDFKNIYLIGYSQGACMTLDAGLTFQHKLGGIIALKGHIPSKTFESLSVKQNVLAVHGRTDKTIGFNVASKSYHNIANRGYNIDFLKQNCNHGLKTGLNEQLKYIEQFIK
jgi:phospholipase/carboxylesterase